MDTLSIDSPELYNERPPIRPEEIQSFTTKIDTLELRYGNIQKNLEERAKVLQSSGGSWSQEDVEMIEGFKQNMKTLESEIFGFQDLPYELARKFTHIESRFYLHVSMIGGLFGRSPSNFLERDKTPYEWGERDENQIKRNFTEAQVSNMDFEVLQAKVLSKYDSFKQRRNDIRTRLNTLIENKARSFTEVKHDLDKLTREMLDFNEELRRLMFYLPDLSDQDMRDIRDGYSNPHTEGSLEAENYNKRSLIYRLEQQGMSLYDSTHDMAFEILDLEKENAFQNGLEQFRNMELSQDPLAYHDVYMKLLNSLGPQLSFGNDIDTKTQAVNDVQEVRNIFVKAYRRSERATKIAYIQTIVAERQFFFDSSYNKHFAIDDEKLQQISDFEVLSDMYSGILSDEDINQTVQQYVVSEQAFESNLGSHSVINLDHEDYRKYRVELRGVKIGGIDAIFTRDADVIFEANEMAHIAFVFAMGDDELISFLSGKDLPILENSLPQSKLRELGEFLSDVSSLNSMIANPEHDNQRLQEEIFRIFYFSYLLDSNGEIAKSNYDKTAAFMQEQVDIILKNRGLSETERKQLFQDEFTQEAQAFLRDLHFSYQEIQQIQEAYLKVGEETLAAIIDLRDKVKIAEELMQQVTTDNNPLSPDQMKIVQGVLETLGYYSSGVDGIWGKNTQQAFLDYQSDRTSK